MAAPVSLLHERREHGSRSFASSHSDHMGKGPWQAARGLCCFTATACDNSPCTAKERVAPRRSPCRTPPRPWLPLPSAFSRRRPGLCLLRSAPRSLPICPVRSQSRLSRTASLPQRDSLPPPTRGPPLCLAGKRPSGACRTAVRSGCHSRPSLWRPPFHTPPS